VAKHSSGSKRLQQFKSSKVGTIIVGHCKVQQFKSSQVGANIVGHCKVQQFKSSQVGANIVGHCKVQQFKVVESQTQTSLVTTEVQQVVGSKAHHLGNMRLQY